MARWTVWAILILFAPAPATAQLEAPDPRHEQWPAAYAGRPLTVPDGLFRLDFVAGGGVIDRRDAAVELAAGAGYGVSDDLEVGLVLINAVVSPNRDTGLDKPSAYLRYRLGAGAAQIAGEVRAEVPTDGRFGFVAAAPGLIAIADVVRLDVRPEARAIQAPGWSTSWRVDGVLTLQLGRRFRLFGGGRISDGISGPAMPMLVQAIGGAAFTFLDGPQTDSDLLLEVRPPAHRLGGADVRRDLSTDWLVVLTYRPFYWSEGSRSSDPFAEPGAW